jgi:hypothetical protein
VPRALEIVQRLGDALAGIDREAAYRKGMAERADIDQTEAQATAALALARDRQLDAEKKERERAAAEEIRRREAELNDPTKLPSAAIMEAGFGDEYAGLQLGRTRAQEFGHLETIGTPSQMFGDELMTPQQSHEAARIAAMEAQAPASALASRRTGNQPMEIVIDDQGNTVYVPRAQAAGQRVGARPSTGSSGAAQPGGLTVAAQSAIYRQAAGAFGGTYDPVTGRFGGLDPDSVTKMQRVASRATAIVRDQGLDIATAVDQALQEARTAAEAGGEIPPQFGAALDESAPPPGIPQGSTLIGHTANGAPVYRTPDGQQLVAE